MPISNISILRSACKLLTVYRANPFSSPDTGHQDNFILVAALSALSHQKDALTHKANSARLIC